MFKKISALLFSSISAKIIQFIYFFIIAHFLSKESLGYYSLSITLFTLICLPLLDFGTELLITKSVAKNEYHPIYQILIWKFASFPVLFFFTFSIGFFYFKVSISLLIAVGILFLIKSLEISLLSILRGFKHNQVESLYWFTSRIFSFVLLITWVFIFSFEITVFLAVLFQIISLTINLLWYSKKYLYISEFQKVQLSSLFSLLKKGAPLAFSSIAWLIYFKIDILLITELLGVKEAGIYDMAYKVMEALFIIPGMIMAIFFSRLASASSNLEYSSLIKQAFFYLFVVAIFIQLIIYFIAPLLLPFYLREDQLEVIPFLKLFSWMIIPVYLGHLTTQILIIKEKNTIYLKITLSAAILNILLNLFWIPLYQTQGAIIATVITEIFVLLTSGIFALFLKNKAF